MTRRWSTVVGCAFAYVLDGGACMFDRPDLRRTKTGTMWTGQAIALLAAGLGLTALVALAVIGWLEHAA